MDTNTTATKVLTYNEKDFSYKLWDLIPVDPCRVILRDSFGNEQLHFWFVEEMLHFSHQNHIAYLKQVIEHGVDPINLLNVIGRKNELWTLYYDEDEQGVFLKEASSASCPISPAAKLPMEVLKAATWGSGSFHVPGVKTMREFGIRVNQLIGWATGHTFGIAYTRIWVWMTDEEKGDHIKEMARRMLDIKAKKV